MSLLELNLTWWSVKQTVTHQPMDQAAEEAEGLASPLVVLHTSNALLQAALTASTPPSNNLAVLMAMDMPATSDTTAPTPNPSEHGAAPTEWT